MSVKVPVSVLEAIDTIDNFLYQNKNIIRSVAQPRNRWDSKKNVTDRVSYHRTAANIVKKSLLNVIVSNT